MKKKLYSGKCIPAALMLMAALAAGVASADAATPSSVGRIRALRSDRAKAGMIKVRREAPAPIMRPSWDVYYYNDGGWVEIGRSDYEYDSQGRQTKVVLDDEGSISTTIYEYDEFGMQTLVLTLNGSGDDARNYSKRTYEYDPIVHDYFIRRMGYDWAGTDWQTNYFCEENQVTRNADGNITEILKSIPYMGGELVPAYHTIWGYDETTGRADRYAYYMNMTADDPKWVLYQDMEYVDIKWDRTDGQLTGELLEMIQGSNRFTSATVYYEDEQDGYIFVTYPEDNEIGYRLVMTTNDPEEIGMSEELELLDPDTFKLSYTVSEYIDPETDQITSEPTYQYRTVTENDSHGNLFYNENYEILPGEEPELVSGERYAYTYDADGNMTESLMSTYYYDEGEYVEEMKVVYGDYIDAAVTGTGLIPAEKSLRVSGLTATACGILTAYTADGRVAATASDTLDLSQLAKGLYIIRSGAESLRFMR